MFCHVYLGSGACTIIISEVRVYMDVLYNSSSVECMIRISGCLWWILLLGVGTIASRSSRRHTHTRLYHYI